MKKILFTALLTLGATLAQAHENLQAAHGGSIVEAPSGARLELLASKEGLTLYLNDHDGQPVPSAGVTVEIVLLSGGKKQNLTLAPGTGNTLTASGSFAEGGESKAIVRITLPGKAVEQVRMTLGGGH